MDNITTIEKLYVSLNERDYEAMMSHLADDIVWLVADNSPFRTEALITASMKSVRAYANA